MLGHTSMTRGQASPMRITKDSALTKTRLCKFFSEGCCSRGDHCTYAHGLDDLQPVPNFSCTKMCPAVKASGACNDPICKYAHSKEQIHNRGAKIAHGRLCKAMIHTHMWMDSRGNRLLIDLDSILHTETAQCPVSMADVTGACSKESTYFPSSSSSSSSSLDIISGVTVDSESTTLKQHEFGSSSLSFEIEQEAARHNECNRPAASYRPLQFNTTLMPIPRLGDMELQSTAFVEAASLNVTCKPVSKRLHDDSEPCKFHLAGMCKRGARCKFAHDAAIPVPSTHCIRADATPSPTEEHENCECNLARTTLGPNCNHTEQCDKRTSQLVVKNTFFSVEPVSAGIRRCCSAPAILAETECNQRVAP